MKKSLFCVVCLSLSYWATADDYSDAHAHYIANMGAMIERGGTRVLFDPLFKNDFDTYDPVPAEVEAALLAGTPPWDDIDAVFVSHYHGDHFDPATLLALLRAQSAVELFAPEQAAAAIRELVDGQDPVLERINGLALANSEAATDIKLGSLLIEAVRIPHGGWPNRHSHVENLVFRVTLDSETTVMHLGDADTGEEHFVATSSYWQERHTHFAMPPYWFFLNDEGRQIIDERIAADHTVGMHVPTEVPDDPEDRPDELKDVDLFTKPGEVRSISVDD